MCMEFCDLSRRSEAYMRNIPRGNTSFSLVLLPQRDLSFGFKYCLRGRFVMREERCCTHSLAMI